MTQVKVRELLSYFERDVDAAFDDVVSRRTLRTQRDILQAFQRAVERHCPPGDDCEPLERPPEWVQWALVDTIRSLYFGNKANWTAALTAELPLRFSGWLDVPKSVVR